MRYTVKSLMSLTNDLPRFGRAGTDVTLFTPMVTRWGYTVGHNAGIVSAWCWLGVDTALSRCARGVDVVLRSGGRGENIAADRARMNEIAIPRDVAVSRAGPM